LFLEPIETDNKTAGPSNRAPPRTAPMVHGSSITGNGIWALVITGKLLVITGNGNH
jgi:hypothetical protein